jgi:hypothetical protein
MWNEAVEGIAQLQQPNIPLTPVQLHAARMNDMIPDNIGCKYASEYCINYW